jgi:acetyltransferase-like isoleucine patch superfamily enzyme
MKKIIEKTVSFVLYVVKLPSMRNGHLGMYFFFRKLRYFFATMCFVIRFAPFIKKFGKNSFILGSSTIKATKGEVFDLSLGNDVLIYDRCEFRGRGVINIGDNTAIGHDNIFSCTSSITIGNNVITADHVKFYTANHKYNDPTLPIKDQGESQGHIILEDNVWIGANVVLLKNAHIKSGAIIGSNAVVTGTVPANEIWGGCPAVKIKDRF